MKHLGIQLTSFISVFAISLVSLLIGVAIGTQVENPQGGLVIDAHEESANGQLVAVMDAARLAGIHKISIANRD